jgi:hypothetical protein
MSTDETTQGGIRGAMTSRTLPDLARSYGPIALATIVFLVMTALVAPVDRQVEALQHTVQAGPSGGPGDAAPGQPGVRTTSTTTTTGDGQPGPGGAAHNHWVPPGGQACTDRVEQLPGEPYTPPCYTFDGDNGGETSRGVTSTDIVVSIREIGDFNLAELFAELSGREVADSPEVVRETILAMAEYFNERFQFWGRQIRIEFYSGQGAVLNEFLSAGQDRALADANRAADDVGAFADISAVTIPYAQALSQQRVVNIGSPYPSRAWYDRNRPYAWSTFPNGTAVVESASSAVVHRLREEPNAIYAGPGLQGLPRKIAILAPENPEYQESVDAFIARNREKGVETALNLRYKLDINSMPTQASNLIAQLKDAQVTTVQCGCDPIMLAIGLAPKANEQSYFPEWQTAGLAFVDQDIVSQLIDSRQWERAYGIAYNAASEPLGGSVGYRAFKTVRPNDEPAFGVEAAHAQMLLLALGLHMAGPNLTPETFEQGLFNYPGGQGPYGFWAFGPGNHTTTDDYREVWWDPNRISPQNGEPGSWVELHGGRRYLRDQPPSGPPDFFQ